MRKIACLLIVVLGLIGPAGALTVNDSVELALAKNPRVIAARATLDAASSRLVQARSALFPRLKLEGGEILLKTAAGAPPGTTLLVQDLFFNTPARAKFLKRDGTERSQILRTLQELALAHPHVNFQATAEGKKAMLLAASAGLRPSRRSSWRRR